MDRRSFIKSSAIAAAGVSIVKPNVLGRMNHISPNNKITVALIGCGTQGMRQMMKHITNEHIRIVAVCDPTSETTNYIEYYDGELRGQIRIFLDDPNWDEGVPGCRCGYLVAKELVDKYYNELSDSESRSDCNTYEDYRELLEKEKDLDAVYVMTPDHHHANIAVAAMKKGKHVIMHKPLATTIEEARYVARVADETGVATHMFCAESLHTTPLLSEWIEDGAIGDVIQVHNWSSRPVWPQAWTSYPTEKVEIPDGFNWDLWLGPAEYREYHPNYTHSLFRGWKDFGSGALGDMGHYSFRQIFQILNLGLPNKIEAAGCSLSEIEKHYWIRRDTDISYPTSSIIYFEFPERENMPEVKLTWYDGSLRPPTPKELEIDNRDMPNEGLLLVGEDGKIFGGFRGDSPRIIPESEMHDYDRPEPYLERPIDGFEQWINACKGGKSSTANFQEVEKLTETVCLGNIALKVSGKLEYDYETMEFKNSKLANSYLSREVRDEWKFM